MMSMKYLIVLPMFLCALAEAKTPWRPSVVGLKWAGNEAVLSTEREPDTSRQQVQLFYKATISSPGKKNETIRREARIVPMSVERDVRSLGYRFVDVNFASGGYKCEATPADPATVRMTAPPEKQNEPVHIRWSGGRVKIHSEVQEGMVYLCSEWTDYRGRRKSTKTRLYKGSTPATIHSIRGQFDEHGVYIIVTETSEWKYVVSKRGILVCDPPVRPASIHNAE